MTGLLLNLVLAVVWSAGVGEMTLETFGFGFLLGYVLLWWLYPVHGNRAYFHKAPRLVGLILFWVPAYLYSASCGYSFFPSFGLSG